LALNNNHSLARWIVFCTRLYIHCHFDIVKMVYSIKPVCKT